MIIEEQLKTIELLAAGSRQSTALRKSIFLLVTFQCCHKNGRSVKRTVDSAWKIPLARGGGGMVSITL